MISPNSCHAITLMNNLAAVLSRQKIPGGDPKDTKITRLHLLRDAQKWAEKALEIDAKITPPIRTEECDRACVAATHNLGEIARMLGKKAIATQRFEEALSLAKGIDLEEGVKAAKEGLGKTAKMKAKDAGNVTPA